MLNRTAIVAAAVSFALFLGLALVFSWLSGPHGEVLARAQIPGPGGYLHSVTVRKFGGRLRTELSQQGQPKRDLPLSSYEFYGGSQPITTAAINWPPLHIFMVRFSNGATLDCAWNETNCTWTLH
jgi:hypothetical protein